MLSEHNDISAVSQQTKVAMASPPRGGRGAASGNGRSSPGCSRVSHTRRKWLFFHERFQTQLRDHLQPCLSSSEGDLTFASDARHCSDAGGCDYGSEGLSVPPPGPHGCHQAQLSGPRESQQSGVSAGRGELPAADGLGPRSRPANRAHRGPTGECGVLGPERPRSSQPNAMLLLTLGNGTDFGTRMTEMYSGWRAQPGTRDPG